MEKYPEKHDPFRFNDRRSKMFRIHYYNCVGISIKGVDTRLSDTLLRIYDDFKKCLITSLMFCKLEYKAIISST